MVGAHLDWDCKASRDFAITCIHQGVVFNMLAAEVASFAARQRQQTIETLRILAPTPPSTTTIDLSVSLRRTAT